ncbi:MAG: nucleotidyl transferase AbiEii/AbiGii toxin family protein [Candidatus Methylomirabilales bacterium]
MIAGLAAFPTNHDEWELRPYFLWDTPLTWREFREALASDRPFRRRWAFARLLREARWADIWRLVSVAQVEAELPFLSLPDKWFWEFVIEGARATSTISGEVVEVEGVPVASFEQVLLGKMAAACDRVEAKDAVDLWAAATQGADLYVLADRLAEKDPRFLLSPERWPRALEALRRALPDLALPETIWAASLVELQEFLGREASLALLKILPPDAAGHSAALQ